MADSATTRFRVGLRAHGASRERGLIGSLRQVGVGGVARSLAGAILPEQPALVRSAERVPLIRDEPRESFCWADLTSARREIARRRAVGLITDEEAQLLRHWSARGYVILRQCIPNELVDAALADVERCWSERWHVNVDLLTTGERTFVDQIPGDARHDRYKLNDLYMFSKPARDIFLHPRIVRFGELIFDHPVVGCNSLTFQHGSQQPAHVDHVYMTPKPARRLFASWIALEDVRPEAGPLELWPGSHRLPPFSFGGDHPYHYQTGTQEDHTRYLDREKQRFPHEQFLARRGDVLLWHAMLVHGGGPIARPGTTRWSMACHYFSQEIPGLPGDLGQHGRAFYMRKGLDDPD